MGSWSVPRPSTTFGVTVARTRWLLAPWLLASLLLVLWPWPASACSCAMQVPEEAIAQSDGAFVGTLQEQQGDRWVFQVEAVLAGDLTTPLVLQAAVGDGANCGLTPDPGGRYGLLLYREADGHLSTNGCLQHDPDSLLKAGEPREATPVALEDAPARSAGSDGGWGIVLGTIGGGLAVLGALVMWARRRPTG